MTIETTLEAIEHRLEIVNHLGEPVHTGRYLGAVYTPGGTLILVLCDDGPIREAHVGRVRKASDDVKA